MLLICYLAEMSTSVMLLQLAASLTLTASPVLQCVGARSWGL